MGAYKIPKVPKTYRYSLNDLLGVDFNDAVVDNRRSPLMTNLVNNNGFLESRNGHKIVMNVANNRINGVWNMDTTTEVFIVHCGTKLYLVDSEFTSATVLKENLNDIKSSGIVYNNQLLIFDGKRALIYHKNNNVWTVDYLDTVGYIPTTSISRSPNGTNSKSNESINQLTYWRTNTFLGTATDKTYQLDGDAWDSAAITVKQLQNDGVWHTISSSNYSYNRNNGKVTFTTAPGESPVSGRDNIEITFKAGTATTGFVNYVNKCTIATMFGYNGNNNRIFITGNEDVPNVDWWSYVENPKYFPDDNFARIGSIGSPIIGYSRVGDGTLAIHKRTTDTDCTVYYRTSNQLNGKDYFPLTSGVKNIGCINDKCCQNFLNDPVFLSELGVYSIINESNVTDTKFAEERSYYIKPKLLKEENLDDAVAIVNGNRYYLAVNNKIYVADKRFLSNTDNSESSYQYEWFLLTNIPVRVFFNWNNKLYWGDKDGNIRTFGSDYMDEFIDDDDELEEVKINTHWESNYLYFDEYDYAKTVRKILVHHRPIGPSAVRLSYIDSDGSHLVSISEYDGLSVYPKVIQEKEKISKIMCCKIAIDGEEDKRCSFNNILVEYRIAGKYRGD